MIISFAAGAASIYLPARFKKKSLETLSREILLSAESEAKRIKEEARESIAEEQSRLKQREDHLERRMQLVERKLTDTEKREMILRERGEQAREKKRLLEVEWERVAGLSKKEAKEELLSKIESDLRGELAVHINEVEAKKDREAARILATAIGRLAVPTIADNGTAYVSLPNEEMKRRVIGREGRNIRTLERLTGINFVMDEMPGAVLLSGFDPIRLHVAKLALSDLIVDGRIHPTRIEEAVDQAKKKTEEQITTLGEEAAQKTGCYRLHPELIALLGKMHFRISNGQNLLAHSIEVSSLLGILCAELGLDERLGRRIGLLHDMGKVVSHERQGTHAMIGYELALKYGEPEAVANGIGCHHNEMEPITIEGSLCQAADALSAARPGARHEAIESYVKRLSKLEALATSFEGVTEAYALQAGREVRVIVEPKLVDDAALTLLARNLAKKIEETLSYPGKIKVTVLRHQSLTVFAR